MSRVVVFDEFGGPEVLHIVSEPDVEPAVGEVRIRIEAFAVNPLDAMMRSGTSPGVVPLPHARLGIEASGVIDAVGVDVTGFGVGDRVMIAALPDATVRGAYAEYTTLPASQVVPSPAGIDVDAVRRHTGGVGADIAFDLVRGPGQRQLLDAARPGRTLVAAGYLDPRPTPEPGDLPVTVLNYRGWDHLLDLEELRRTVAFLEAGVHFGAVRPAIDTVFTFDDVIDAHRRREQGLHSGKKIVVRV